VRVALATASRGTPRSSRARFSVSPKALISTKRQLPGGDAVGALGPELRFLHYYPGSPECGRLYASNSESDAPDPEEDRCTSQLALAATHSRATGILGGPAGRAPAGVLDIAAGLSPAFTTSASHDDC